MAENETNELLEKKQYLVGITIIEGRNILGKDSSGQSDPFVKVKCAGQIQQTEKKYEVNSATWNQSLTFKDIYMNKYELETFELNMELYDHNALLANEMIGQYSIGLSTLYRNLNHEFYRTWVGMFNPKENPNNVQAYLLINCFIIGPGERPPVHSADEEQGDDVDDSEEDEQVIAQKIESIKRAQGIIQILAPNKIVKSWQMTVQIDSAKDLIQVQKDKKIMPFVSARVNGMVLTTITGRNFRPQFKAKLQFPIYYPILNNKITLRLWSAKGGLKQNLYIGNIPEHPDMNDFFNLTKLAASDGSMSCRWFNLYGTPPMERSGKTTSRTQGSDFLGRVLVAFSLISNERPQLNQGQAGKMKEPKTRDYQIWVDLYDLVGCEEISEGSEVWAVVKIGGEKPSERHHAAWYDKKGKKFYRWKVNQVPAMIDIKLPHDFAQIPDIFINFYTRTTWEKDGIRFAYIRLRAQDCISTKPCPQWLRLSSPYNDSKPVGMVMINVQFLKYDTNVPKVYDPIRISKPSKSDPMIYKFYYQIFQGFEICSSVAADKLKTSFQLAIGNHSAEKSMLATEFVDGRYPVWNKCDSTEVKLHEDLTFEADMRVILKNQEDRFFGGLSNKIIGELAVPVKSLTKKTMCDRPQFFNIINEEGQFCGQVLANFFLKFYPKDPSKRKIKNYVPPEHKKLLNYIQEATEQRCKVSIGISVFGLRNLMAEAKEPQITIKLTNADKCIPEQDPPLPKQFELVIDDDWLKSLSITASENPNIGKIVTFEKVILPREPLCWPYLEIQITDKANGFLSSGCDDFFTTVSLLDFAPENLLKPRELIYAKTQLSRNQDRLSIVQNMIEPNDFLTANNIFVAKDEEIDFQNLANGGNQGPDMAAPQGGGNDAMRATNMGNGQQMQVINGDAKAEAKKQGTLNLFDIFGRGTIGVEDIEIYVDGPKADGGETHFDGDEMIDPHQLVVEEAAGGTTDLESGVIVCTDEVMDVNVTKNAKEAEQKEREGKIDKLDEELKGLQRKLKSLDPDNQQDKSHVRLKMMDVTDSIVALKDEPMDEGRFWGMLALDDDDAFDYGRDILKEVIYDTKISLPYVQFPLFQPGDWYQQPQQTTVVQVSSILRSGKLTEASFKGKIEIKKLDSSDDEDDSDSDEENKDEEGEAEKDQKVEAVPDTKWDQVNAIVEEAAELYPFDIMQREFLDVLVKDIQNYKIRVYLITAQNLTATGTVIDMKSRLAGMTALSTANPFPVIKVGDGIWSEETKNIKKVGGEDMYKADTLNPEFFQVWDLDAKFPEDWKLEIAIFDKGAFRPSLIGHTVIDLENRHFANVLWRDRQAIKIHMDRYNVDKKQIGKEKAKLGPKKFKFKQQLLKLKNEQNRKYKKIIANVEQILIPVDFRELVHPSKTQAQGIVESWVEIYSIEENRKIPYQAMKQVKRETFEIRLIVWETRYVPLVDGDNVDIYVRVTFDPTGWAEDQIEKRTDVHSQSKTGWGSFNWRFKFDLEVPCDFPRIKFMIHDDGVFVDESIGEATINLKKSIQKLQKEGLVEVPKTYISCWNTNMKDVERGILMFSLTMLPKEDADADPVGESWDEPNHSPFLKKPTAGRGVFGSFGGGFSWDMDWNPFGKLLPILGVLFVILFILTIIMWWRLLG